MKSEAYYNKNRRKKKPLTYNLYNILDPLTKNLVRMKSFFKKNPFAYISFKMTFGMFAMILPLILVCFNSYYFIISENDNQFSNYKIPLINNNDNNHSSSINNSSFNLNKSIIILKDNHVKNIYNDVNNASSINGIFSEDYYYSDFPAYNEAEANINLTRITTTRKISSAIIQVNFTNTFNQIKNDKKFIKEYKNKILQINNLTESNTGNNTATAALFHINTQVGLFYPFKVSIFTLIIMLMGYVIYKLYYCFFVTK